MRVADYLDLPQDTSKDAFIIRVNELSAENLRRYVLPLEVMKRLDDLLGVVGQRLAQRRDVGRFIYGGFGSGKSHLLQILGRMLAHDEAVYGPGCDPRLRELRQKHPWIDRERPLVVPINMMGKQSLVQALYEGYNAALPAGVALCDLSDHERVFRLVERDAARLGGTDGLIERLRADGIVPSREFYDRGRNGTVVERQDLAAKLHNWRNHGEMAIRPEQLWLEAPDGFAQLSAHAEAQGYTAIVWLIDELIIWIREKTHDAYAREINHLSALVDHDGRSGRTLPFLALVSVQADIAETCPQDMSEAGFREHLGFVADRFRPQLVLEDTDLYEVCERRVLARKDDAARRALDAEIEKTLRAHAPVLETLQADVRPEQVRGLYPFHPALLRVLMDVTQAFSRSRTGVQILYALLREYAADLEVGQFVPLGTLFDAIFTVENRTELKQNKRSHAQQQFVAAAEAYERLQPHVLAVSGTTGQCPYDGTRGCSRCLAQHDDETHRRCFELNQVVKSVLLCQQSHKPFFANGRALADAISVKNLLRLNLADLRARTELGGVAKVAGRLAELAARAQQVRITGTDGEATVAIDTTGVDVQRILDEALAHVQHADRFQVIRELLNDELALGLEGARHDRALAARWRGTQRKGRLRLCNVRTVPYVGAANGFDPGDDAFLVLVDYPFDEDAARTVHDDVETLERARARARQWTVTWLPEFFDEAERHALDLAAAIEIVRADEANYLVRNLRASEVEAAKRQLDTFRHSQTDVLRAAIGRRYFEHGQLWALQDGIDTALDGLDRADSLETLARRVLDARYPQHPRFKRNVSRGDLANVMEWVTKAAQTQATVKLTPLEMQVVENLAVPLELVHTGEGSIDARPDGRFLRRVLEWRQGRTQFRARELRALLMGEGKDGFGLTRELADAFVFYLLQVEGYEAVSTKGEGITVAGLDRMPDDFVLRQDDVVDAPTWDTARNLAKALFGIEGRRERPSSPEQAKLSRDVLQAAKSVRETLQKLEADIGHLLGLVEVPLAESQRLQTVRRAAAALGDILQAVGNADRIRALAEIRKLEEAERAAVVATVAHAGEEGRAAASLRAVGTQIQTVRRSATDSERSVCERLATLLKDSVRIRLSDDHVRLKTELELAFGAVMARHAGEQEDSRRRAEAERQQREAEERARREQEALERRKLEEQLAAERRKLEAERRRLAEEEAERKRREAARASGQRRRDGVKRAEVAATAAALVAELLAQVEGDLVDVSVGLERTKP